MTHAHAHLGNRTTVPTLKSQIAWAQGEVRQQSRLASRAAPNSAARRLAEERRRLAEAALRSLQSIKSGNPA